MPRTILSWHRIRARLLAPVAATALLVGAAGAAPAPAVTGAASGAPVPGTGSAAAGHTYQLTLLTGDVVVLHVAPDGRQAAWAETNATARPPRIVERDGHVLALPDEAVPYVQDGVVDERLFDLTYLAESGYHDLARADLPLLVAAPDGPGIRSVPEAPSGTRAERTLASIGALAVTAAKDDVRSVWDDVVAGELGRVWLNGRVEAALDESVPQIGAPAAWEQGLDGAGTTVAVLDTGWDPTHPDLAGQVTGASNFTEDADPEGQTAVDGQGHGTHVAATVAGTGAASGGTHRGVAPGADLLIGKVLDNSGSGYEDWIIAGMEWAVAQGADVVSMSLGTDWASDGTDAMSLAVDRLSAESDALFVIAAGNAGPREGTVGSPGAATSALTVGAVDKDDRAAAFSSRGPRIGDGALKPEVVAPGVDIVAARAAGTSLGNLLDEHYTSLNGTSMATPHVAGAAAILAQQHPDWDDQAIKQRLISSSTPLDGEPLIFQGAGRIDVATAVDETVTVDQGVVDFGRLELDAPAVSRTLTYHNPTDRRITLRVSADVTRPGDGRPALRVRNPVLNIPAGGSASTRVEVSAEASTGGTYSGQIVAQDPRDRDTVIHSVTTFTVERPVHTVTVNATGRDGAPAGGPVDLWNTETGEWTRLFMTGGTAAAEVPEGTYTVVTSAEEEGTDSDIASVTLAAEPDLRVGDDVTLEYDARDAGPVELSTPLEADAETLDVIWAREVGDQSFRTILSQGWNGTELFTFPSREPKTGTFEFSTAWLAAQPLLELRAGGERLLPSPLPVSAPLMYVGDGALPLADAGTGTAAEFAAADVAGKAVLVSRRGDDVETREQVELAAEAGAAVLLVANDRPGAWSEQLWQAVMPAYTVRQETGARLRAELAADPAFELDLTGRRDSTYSYQLAFTEDGLPGAATYTADHDDLAVVESEYRQASQRMNRNESWFSFAGDSPLGSSMRLNRNGPVRRTEYLTADGVEWQRFAQPHQEFANMYWTWSGIRPYAAGTTTEQVWWGPLVAPGMPALAGSEEFGLPVARFRDAIRISVPHYLYGPATYGFIQEQLGDSSELVLRRDGVEVGRSTWSEAQYTVPAAEADFELSLTTESGSGHFSDLWRRTETTWGFRSGRTGAEREVLPLIQLAYDVETGLYNEVAAGVSYPVAVRPAYPAGVDGPGGFSAVAEVSFDDGVSWRPAPVTPSNDGVLTAQVPAADGGFASFRVSVTDADGNTVRQEVDRAWRIGAAN